MGLALGRHGVGKSVLESEQVTNLVGAILQPEGLYAFPFFILLPGIGSLGWNYVRR